MASITGANRVTSAASLPATAIPSPTAPSVKRPTGGRTLDRKYGSGELRRPGCLSGKILAAYERINDLYYRQPQPAPSSRRAQNLPQAAFVTEQPRPVQSLAASWKAEEVEELIHPRNNAATMERLLTMTDEQIQREELEVREQVLDQYMKQAPHDSLDDIMSGLRLSSRVAKDYSRKYDTVMSGLKNMAHLLGRQEKVLDTYYSQAAGYDADFVFKLPRREIKSPPHSTTKQSPGRPKLKRPPFQALVRLMANRGSTLRKNHSTKRLEMLRLRLKEVDERVKRIPTAGLRGEKSFPSCATPEPPVPVPALPPKKRTTVVLHRPKAEEFFATEPRAYSSTQLRRKINAYYVQRGKQTETRNNKLECYSELRFPTKRFVPGIVNASVNRTSCGAARRLQNCLVMWPLST